MASKSRSLRARGLKYWEHITVVKSHVVALFTGAWIEILNTSVNSKVMPVALFTGAWIEIYIGSKKQVIFYRRALYGRVDWNVKKSTKALSLRCRALYGRVDWNYNITRTYNQDAMSRSLRARGLKYTVIIFYNNFNSRALYGRVDWNELISNELDYLISRALYGRVDWNARILPIVFDWLGRALYGRVDWNGKRMQRVSAKNSRALYGRVDWNLINPRTIVNQSRSRSLRARGLKSEDLTSQPDPKIVALFTGAWIEIIV